MLSFIFRLRLLHDRTFSTTRIKLVCSVLVLKLILLLFYQLVTKFTL